MKLVILNNAVVTQDGEYTLRTITPAAARQLVRENEIFSLVGHYSTAYVCSQVLGIEVKRRRKTFKQKVGQKALIFKVNCRIKEGEILTAERIEEIGFTFKLLERRR